jgi:hypothetical protein
MAMLNPDFDPNPRRREGVRPAPDTVVGKTRLM